MHMWFAAIGAFSSAIGASFCLEHFVGRYVDAVRPAESRTLAVDEQNGSEFVIVHTDVI